MTQGYGADVAFVTDGATQFHLATKDLGIGFKHKQSVNPLERGHIAFRTDDIEAFKQRLDEKRIPKHGAFQGRAQQDLSRAVQIVEDGAEHMMATTAGCEVAG